MPVPTQVNVLGILNAFDRAASARLERDKYAEAKQQRDAAKALNRIQMYEMEAMRVVGKDPAAIEQYMFDQPHIREDLSNFDDDFGITKSQLAGGQHHREGDNYATQVNENGTTTATFERADGSVAPKTKNRSASPDDEIVQNPGGYYTRNLKIELASQAGLASPYSTAQSYANLILSADPGGEPQLGNTEPLAGGGQTRVEATPGLGEVETATTSPVPETTGPVATSVEPGAPEVGVTEAPAPVVDTTEAPVADSTVPGFNEFQQKHESYTPGPIAKGVTATGEFLGKYVADPVTTGVKAVGKGIKKTREAHAEAAAADLLYNAARMDDPEKKQKLRSEAEQMFARVQDLKQGKEPGTTLTEGIQKKIDDSKDPDEALAVTTEEDKEKIVSQAFKKDEGIKQPVKSIKNRAIHLGYLKQAGMLSGTTLAHATTFARTGKWPQDAIDALNIAKHELAMNTASRAIEDAYTKDVEDYAAFVEEMYGGGPDAGVYAKEWFAALGKDEVLTEAQVVDLTQQTIPVIQQWYPHVLSAFIKEGIIERKPVLPKDASPRDEMNAHKIHQARNVAGLKAARVVTEALASSHILDNKEDTRGRDPATGFGEALYAMRHGWVEKVLPKHPRMKERVTSHLAGLDPAAVDKIARTAAVFGGYDPNKSEE